jgi:hypothetical protein
MQVHSMIRITALLAAVAVWPVAAQNTGGFLKTKVHPSRAGVFIDDKYVGPAGNFCFARKYAVAPGEHEVKLLEPRYEDLITKVTVQAGQTAEINQSMKPVPLAKPPFGRLRTFSADKFAAVFVNGKYMGHADEFSNPGQGLLLNPGEYIVKIVPVGSEQGREERVTLQADKVTIVRAE